MTMSADDQLTALRLANSPEYTYDMLVSLSDDVLETIQQYTLEDLREDEDGEEPIDPRIIIELRRFLSNYIVLFATDRRGGSR